MASDKISPIPQKWLHDLVIKIEESARAFEDPESPMCKALVIRGNIILDVLESWQKRNE